MISIKIQKILAFIPLINCSILFISFFINSKFMREGWLFVLIKHIFLGFVSSLPFIFLLWYLEDVLTFDLSFLTFYIFSVINAFSLILAQNKMINR